MSIRFIYGRSGSGKTHYCFQDIKRRLEQDVENPLILIIPEQFSFQTEKNIIENMGYKGMHRVQVLSFRRMADYVLDEVGGGINRHINDSGKNILLYKVIEENKNVLQVFKKIRGRQGLISDISRTIKELKSYDITVHDMEESTDHIENLSLKRKMEDIAVIFSKFQERMRDNYVDDEDALDILKEKMDSSSMFNGAQVWVDEFSRFTPQEYGILEKIMNRAQRVNFTLCMGSESDLFAPVETTEKKLLEIAERNNIIYEKPVNLKEDPCYKFRNSREFQHLEKYMFSYPYRQYKYRPKNIKLFKSLNKFSEVENTARDIIRICRDKDFRFRDISVVSGDLDGYENIIKAIFNEYNIPYFIDEKRKIDNNPIIVLIISAVEIISKNWSYESVFRYLKTWLLDFEKEDIDILENYVLENGIKGSTWLMEEPWEFKTSYSMNENKDGEKEKQLCERINSIRDRVRGPLKKLSAEIKGRKNGREKCSGLYNFLCDINLPDKIQNMILEFKKESRLDKANEYSQIWDIVVDTLDQIVDTIGNDVFSMDTFSQVLSSGFSEYKIGVIPPSLDQVLVGSVDRIRSHDVKALYILGANDGIFPTAIASNGVFTDGDRDQLKERGIELMESRRIRAFEEQFSIYRILTIMDSYLRISYAMGEDDGKTKRPSIVISRLKKIFPEIIEESDLLSQKGKQDGLDAVSVPKATFNKLIQNIRKDSESGTINPLWLDVYRWYSSSGRWHGSLERVFRGFSYTNKIEIADTRRVRKLYGNHLNISVSRLEKFVQCPFAYFIQYGLKAKERKVYNLTPPDIGSFMHNVIHVFSKKIKEDNLSWNSIDRKWCSKNVSLAISNMLEERPNSILNSSNRYRHIASRIRRVLTRAVWLIMEHIKRSRFNPEGYELSFGISGDLPPISVKLHSGEEVNLSGRVDRVDIMHEGDEDYVRVVDYKSGVKEFDISDLYYGLQIQLLVYLDVILSEIQHKMDKNAIPGAILYFRLDDPIVKGKENMSYEEIEKRIAKSLRMNGLLLNDPDIIKDMDSSIDGTSDIIPASIKKNGEISSRSSVATLEQFNMLRKYVRVTMASLCERILEGDIKISPFKEKARSGCDFCIYSSVCQFDTLIKGNSYNVFEKKNVDEIWKEIEETLKKN